MLTPQHGQEKASTYKTVSREDLSTARQRLWEEIASPLFWTAHTAVTLQLNTSCSSILCHISHIFIINMKNESENVKVLVTHSCPTLYGLQPTRFLSLGFSRQGCQSGVALSFPRRLPTQGSNLGSLELQADFYRLSNQGKYKKISCIFKMMM